jgi:hypothetical protein
MRKIFKNCIPLPIVVFASHTRFPFVYSLQIMVFGESSGSHGGMYEDDLSSGALHLGKHLPDCTVQYLRKIIFMAFGFTYQQFLINCCTHRK